MKHRSTCLSLLTLLCLLVAVASASASVLYSNGPINGNINAWNIDSGIYTVADSFTLTAAAGVNNVDNMGLWLAFGTPLTVNWAITSQPLGGTVYGSGTATLSNTFLFTNGFGYNVYSSSFTFPTVNLGPGTYYLNLNDATATGGDTTYWDENDGPSSAFQTFTGPIPSESFEITGSSGGGVPEPATLFLLGSGLFGIGGLARKRVKKT